MGSNGPINKEDVDMKRVLGYLCAFAMLMSMSVVTHAEETSPSLCELAAGYGFKLGAPLSFGQMYDKKYLSFVTQHFNSLTCTNETKAYSLLDQKACQKSPDGMPRMNYTSADVMVRFAQENGIGVRGHVLVWDAYMPDWFFREGYQNGKSFVTREVMMARLQSYIEQVVCHFEDKFPGVIYCWDVVNEAIGDSATEWDGSDARHIRTVRSGVPNYFRDVIGNDYVELSFLYARDAVEKTGADIRLFYNDYNMFYDQKRNAACALVKSINSYAVNEDGTYRRLIDGVGMQGYIGGYGTQKGCMNENDLALMKKSILQYASLGMEVNMTELSVRSYEGDDKTMEKHADFYAKLFQVFMDVNSGEDKPLTGVSIWGVVDCDNLPSNHYTYKLNGPYCGLFNLKLQCKPAYDAVYELMLGEAE